MKNFYDMLSVPPQAPADEIKKAFRREIARYHPDKVQHLGPEFQEMAAGIAADLTEAYRVLMDPTLRARYDEDLGASGGQPAYRPAAAPASPVDPTMPPPPPPPAYGTGSTAPPPAAPRPTAGFDFVKRASLSKIREAIADVLDGSDPMSVPGFDVAVVTKPKKALFRKPEESVCMAIRLVPFVDAEAVTSALTAGAKIRATGAAGCVVILMGQGLAEARDLAAAVSEQRRKLRGATPLLVPVDVRDWEALFPPETPGSVRSLIQRLKDEKR